MANTCQYCGREFDSVHGLATHIGLMHYREKYAAQQAALKEAVDCAPPPERRCQFCDTRAEPGWVYCPYCGICFDA